MTTNEEGSSVSFTESLREAAGDQWDRVVHHRFTNELADGSIDRAVLKRYLVQDYRFLDSFVVLLASMVAHCRSLADRLPGCQFLAVITGSENTYFERALSALGLPEGEEERVKIPNDDCTTNFCQLMREAAASGSLGEMLAVLVVCEWSYHCWGERVAANSTTVRDDFCCYEWIDLHSGPAFQSVVTYLRGLLDAEGQRLDDADKEKVKQRFLRAVQLEEDFFENAYKK
jgi:thiaminase (transcriptional activator TenA)